MRLITVFLLGSILAVAQTPSVRQYLTNASGQNLQTYQVQYQGISSTKTPETVDVYLGKPGDMSAGSVSTGANTVSITIRAANGFYAANGWAIPANSTVNLAAIWGAWLQGGFSISCSDSSSGTGCAAAHLGIWYQK